MVTGYLIEGPITDENICELINNTSSGKIPGAISIFIGQVRADKVDGRKVAAIEYSAYDQMVTRAAEKIKETVFSDFGEVNSISILHSTGRVLTGEKSLAVIVSSVHRRQAQKACDKVVELIKKNFPVWKKEIFDDGSWRWTGDQNIRAKGRESELF